MFGSPRQKVQWAAMDFLLQSYKKHRKWVWLKQFLLLLLRMMIVAVVVAMLAQWITRGEWLDILGGKVTHHYVLLDDSGSMGESYNAMTAYGAPGCPLRSPTPRERCWSATCQPRGIRS